MNIVMFEPQKRSIKASSIINRFDDDESLSTFQQLIVNNWAGVLWQDVIDSVLGEKWEIEWLKVLFLRIE